MQNLWKVEVASATTHFLHELMQQVCLASITRPSNECNSTESIQYAGPREGCILNPRSYQIFCISAARLA
jgi:hypothetical protein